MGINGLNEILHFTDSPEIQSFTEVKFNKNDNVYGVSWANVVREYLKTAYSGECDQAEVVSYGVKYKVLRRGEVTAFYDADGNTLFDVENTRLKKEYGWVMSNAAETAMEEDSETKRAEDEEDNTEGVVATEVEVSGSFKERAREKLEKELKAAKDKSFAAPVIGYLLKRCKEDEGLAQDVVQEHKTWNKCFDYIYEQARRQATGNRTAAVRDDVVYEWAEDYYHKDDKAEEEKKAKKEAERKARQKRENEERKAKVEEKAAEDTKGPSSDKERNADDTTQREQSKIKRNSNDIKGQLDLFSMMGM